MQSDTDLIFFIYIFYICSKKSALLQSINCQLFDTLLSFELESRMLETNRHFTPELLICALGDLNMSNLAYTARLLEWQRSTLFDLYENFFYLLFALGSRFACVRLLPYTVCYIMSTSGCPCLS